MWGTTGDGLFHWGRVIMDYGLYDIWVKNILMLDLSHLLSSPDVNWWTGVVWIIVMFLSDSHSDGTHSLQSIHCWDTDAETHFYKPDEETNSSTCLKARIVLCKFHTLHHMLQSYHHHSSPEEVISILLQWLPSSSTHSYSHEVLWTVSHAAHQVCPPPLPGPLPVCL